MTEEKKPQRIRIASARVDLTLALMTIAEAHDLSSSEMTFLVTEKLLDWTRSSMREKKKRP